MRVARELLGSRLWAFALSGAACALCKYLLGDCPFPDVLHRAILCWELLGPELKRR